MLASDFYAAGHLDAPQYLHPNGRLVDYTTLKPDPRSHHDLRLDFDNWSLNATGHPAYRLAVQGAFDGLSGREQDFSVGP